MLYESSGSTLDEVSNYLEQVTLRLNTGMKIIIDKYIENGVSHITFTGGEPSLDIERLVKCLDYLKSVDSKIFTIINTNGSNLDKLKGIKSLDNIALSRHSMFDDENFEFCHIGEF